MTIDAAPAADAGLDRALSLGALLGRLQRALRREARLGLSGPALAPSQVEVLRLLEREPDLRVQDVATSLWLAPNTASTLVQQLVRLGYLRRTVDARDRRVARLALTPAARERLLHWRDARAVALQRALDGLDPANRDAMRAAMPALERLADLLEGSGP